MDIRSDVTFIISTIKEQAALYNWLTGYTSLRDLALKRMIRMQRADRHVYCSSSSYRPQ
jgi:hypothetical protein